MDGRNMMRRTDDWMWEGRKVIKELNVCKRFYATRIKLANACQPNRILLLDNMTFLLCFQLCIYMYSRVLNGAAALNLHGT